MKKAPRKVRPAPVRTRGGKGRSAPAAAGEDQRRPRFSHDLEVLYEDDALIVVAKPSGMLAVPIPGASTPSALSLLAEALRPRRQRALIVHRIDRFASGALLFAKTEPDREALIEQFLGHTPVRQYLAVVRGPVEPAAGTLVHYFRRQGMYQQLRKPTDPHATRAELRYQVERPLRDASLLRIDLVTGLQNQIRAQFWAEGHPLIGDRKYAPSESAEALIARVALHACYLQIVHPRTGKNISVTCDPPADFRSLVSRLSRPRRGSVS
jgi:RluA family pseudouridine synthase